MKKLLALLTAGVLASVVMIGCTAPEEGDPAATTTNTSTGTEPAATPDTSPAPANTEGATAGTAGATDGN